MQKYCLLHLFALLMVFKVSLSSNSEFKDKLLRYEQKLKDLDSQIIAELNALKCTPDIKTEKNYTQIDDELKPITIGDDLSKCKSKVNNLQSTIDYLRNTNTTVKSCVQYQGTEGIFEIDIPNEGISPVYCESGWTVIQRNNNGSLLNYGIYSDYERGFGYLKSDYFIGLEKLHRLTSAMPHELYIFLVSDLQNIKFAYYDDFLIGGKSEFYKIKSLGQYYGNIGNILEKAENQGFSTANGWWCDSGCVDISSLNKNNIQIRLDNSEEYFSVTSTKMLIRQKINMGNGY